MAAGWCILIRCVARGAGVDVEHLLEAVRDHGFDSLRTFRRIAEPFVARLKLSPAVEAPQLRAT